MKKFLILSLIITIVFFSSGCSKDNNTTTTSTADSIVVALTPANWDYYGTSTEKYYVPTAGKFEFTAEGVKGFGQAARYGSFLVTRDGFDVDKKTIYMK